MLKLSTYFWQGITPFGINKHGIIYATSLHHAKKQLNSSSIIVRQVKKEVNNRLMSQQQLILLCRQITTLLQANIPITSALELLKLTNNNKKVNFLITTLSNDLDNGHTLSEALKKHPQVFNSFVCSVIAIGETSGNLDVSLEIVTAYYEKNYVMYKNIQKALIYPSIVLSIGILIFIVMCVVIVPQFENLFQNTTKKLPFITQFVIQTSHIICNYGNYMLIFIIIISLFCYKFKRIIISLASQVPIFHILYKKIIIARFTQTLSMACSAGISFVDALELLDNLTQNTKYKQALHTIIQDMRNGNEIHVAFTKASIFPNMITHMLKIGSEAGRLNLVLAQVAQYYQDVTEQNLARIMSLLEPILTILLGVFVGGLIIAMYMPLLQLGTIISI